jgi:murein DD-endopeptidase MepM/ murein hydrolase activator NlpD
MRARVVVLHLLPLVALALLSGLVRADGRLFGGPVAGRPPSTAFEIESSLASLEQQERTARAKLEGYSVREQELKRRVTARGRLLYRLERMGLLPIGTGGFRGLVDHAMRVERIRRALDQDLAESTDAASQKLALARQLDELATRRAPLEIERQAAERARIALAETEDRRQAFDRAFQSSTGASDYVAVYGGGLGPDGPSAPSASTEGFRRMKGRLPFPILGRAEIKVVHREGAAGPGVEMRASPGAPVRAVFAGRIAFADTYGSFGKIIILDHGDRYYTLMGNLGSTDVRVGDDVSAGSTIGSAGDDSSGSGTMLYFEVRHGSTTLEPGPWLGL